MELAAKVNSLCVTGVEFVEVCKEYLLVFTQLAQGKVVPVAILDLRDAENLFVSKEGACGAKHVPALVRRYPFVVAELQYQRTEIFCKRWQEMGLLIEKNAKADLFGGMSFAVKGLMVVAERKQLQLTDKQAIEIFRSEQLSWIYAHLVSLSNLNRLVDMLANWVRASSAAA